MAGPSIDGHGEGIGPGADNGDVVIAIGAAHEEYAARRREIDGAEGFDVIKADRQLSPRRS